MGQLHNFLVAQALPERGSLDEKILGEEVIRHVRVLRIREGEHVRFLDGQGGVTEAVCRSFKPSYNFDVTSFKKRDSIQPNIELCLAPPRGDDLREAITQATEVGIRSIRFLKSEHTQYASGQEAPTQKSQRVSDSSCEQCGRAWRCEIHPGWHTLSATLALPGTHIFADESLSESGEAIGFTGALPPLDGPNPVRLYIGPEGGWSDAERHLIQGKAAPLSLGSLILRVPTAVVAATHFLRTVYWHSRS